MRACDHFTSHSVCTLCVPLLCRYTTTSNVSRARSYLYHGQRKFMLYTERYHYYFRPKLRGVKHIVFYGLPQFSEFYPEFLNSVEASSDATCSVIYSRYDALRLERVVGSSRARRMLTSTRPVHLFT